MTVDDFLRFVAAHPDNKQTPSLRVTLVPHNPRTMKRSDEPADNRLPGPNCSFDTSNGTRTIREAGLVMNATLQQPEYQWRD